MLFVLFASGSPLQSPIILFLLCTSFHGSFIFQQSSSGQHLFERQTHKFLWTQISSEKQNLVFFAQFSSRHESSFFWTYLRLRKVLSFGRVDFTSTQNNDISSCLRTIVSFCLTTASSHESSSHSTSLSCCFKIAKQLHNGALVDTVAIDSHCNCFPYA